MKTSIEYGVYQSGIYSKYNIFRNRRIYIPPFVFLLIVFVIGCYYKYIKGMVAEMDDDYFTFWYLLIPSFLIALLFQMIFQKYHTFTFFCPKCLHVILAGSINNVKCPSCKTVNKTFYQIISKCKSCKLPLKYFKCPHCGYSIDLHKKYNEKLIKQKIYGK